MKITIVQGAFLPVPPLMGGAVEKIWFSLGQEFVRRGHEVVQISRALPQLPRSEIIDGVRHIRVAGFDTPRSLVWLKFLDLIYSLRARRLLRPADILVTNTFWLPMLQRDDQKGKIYVHVARFPKGQMKFYAHSARLQAVSHAVADAITAEEPALAKKVKTIPNPLPPQAVVGGVERTNTILFVGRIHPEKGLDLLIKSLHEISPAELKRWTVEIVGPVETKFGGGGDAYLALLKKSAGDLPCAINWRGAIFDDVELAKRYRAARIFVYPSLAEKGESFGVAPLEAMAAGCAVLVSNLACFQDFIEDRRTGFVFDHRASNPSAALAGELSKLMSDETLLARIAQAGYEKSSEYSVSKIADQYLADFHSLLENHDAKRPVTAG
jgi:glycosyltransferase involved in cell wall biosynthesis